MKTRLVSNVLGKNHVEVIVGGYILEIRATAGLHVFVYREETASEGCVAMAYDSSIPVESHQDLHLTGEETP